MKETGIIFNTEMVKAILDSKKTQTRRVIKPQPEDRQTYYVWKPRKNMNYLSDVYWLGSCPYGQVGDRLWVRETWRIEKENPVRDRGSDAILYYDEPTIMYRADKLPHIQQLIKGWKPSIHMFKKYARIWLEITEVRVERVQEITEEDAKAEGCIIQCDCGECIDSTEVGHFQDLWNSLNAKRGYGWEVNPWVWVIRFRVIK